MSDPLYLLSGGLINGSTLALPIFFFLSGLLVAQSLDHCPTRLNFLWRRFLRLYPAVFFTILITALVIGPLVTVLPLRTYFSDPLLFQYLQTVFLLKIGFWLPGVFIHSPLGSSVNSPLWSLALELKLYLALWLLSFIKNRKLTAALIVTAIIVFLTFGAFYPYLEPKLQNRFGGHFQLYPYTDLATYFLSGTLCHYLHNRIVVRNYWLILCPVAWLLTRHLLIADLISLLTLPALVLSAAVNRTRLLSRITPKPDLSYGFFLWGFPIEQLVIIYLHPENFNIRFLATILFALPLALFSWYFIESPALKLKNRIR